MENTDIRVSIVKGNKAALQQTAINNGSVYFIEDTKELFFDFDSQRVEVKDILTLDTDSERTSILFAPLNKFYFVLETGILWFYKDGTWYQVSGSLSIDDMTIKLNSNDKIETVAIKTLDGIIKKEWIGTSAEYEIALANGTIDENTECRITDDESDILVGIGVASESNLGLVKPDGTTLTVSEDGTLTVIGGVSGGGSGNGTVDLTNYYTKDETYSKAEIDAIVGDINSILDSINGENV